MDEVDRIGKGNVSALTLGGDMSILASLNATRSGFGNILGGEASNQNHQRDFSRKHGATTNIQ